MAIFAVIPSHMTRWHNHVTWYERPHWGSIQYTLDIPFQVHFQSMIAWRDLFYWRCHNFSSPCKVNKFEKKKKKIFISSWVASIWLLRVPDYSLSEAAAITSKCQCLYFVYHWEISLQPDSSEVGGLCQIPQADSDMIGRPSYLWILYCATTECHP